MPERRRHGRRARTLLEGDDPGRHRWLLSYADTVTLLFALFLVLFAYAAQAQRLRALSQAPGQEVAPSRATVAPPPARTSAQEQPDPVEPRPTGLLTVAVRPATATAVPDAQAVARTALPRTGEPTARPPDRWTPRPPTEVEGRRRDLRARLEQTLGPELSALVEVRPERRGLVVALVDSPVLFPSGRTELAPLGLGVLTRLAAVQQACSLPVRVEGHTDDVPVKNERFRSNWELSALRATAVAESLIEAGVDPHSISVMGYGESRPRASNSTAEGRAANRRVEVVFLVE